MTELGGVSAMEANLSQTVMTWAEQAGQEAACYPLKVEILRPAAEALDGWNSPPPSGYSRSHGL